MHKVKGASASGYHCFVSRSVASLRSILLPLLVMACTFVKLKRIQLAKGGTGPGTYTLIDGAHVSSTTHAALRPHHFCWLSGSMESFPSTRYRVERLLMALSRRSVMMEVDRATDGKTYIKAVFSDGTVTLTATESSFRTGPIELAHILSESLVTSVRDITYSPC